MRKENYMFKKSTFNWAFTAALVVNISILGLIVWVAWHFISKWW